MDKQEVINEIEKIDYQNLKYNSPERMLSEQKQLIIDIIDKLDEPQKVKVPQLPSKIAKYLEWAKEEQFDFTEDYNMISWENLRTFGGDDTEYLQMWFFDNDQKENERRHILFLQAYTDRYEVEEEPLYTVTINLDRKYHLVLDEGDGNDEISTTLTTSHGVLGYRYFLTEKEIKSVDENLWPFAVPVEKV